MLCNLVVGVVLLVLSFAVPILHIVYVLYVLAIIIPGLAIEVRRLHDIDKSGWWWLIAFVPFIGSIWLIVLFVLPGTPGPNRFGASALTS